MSYSETYPALLSSVVSLGLLIFGIGVFLYMKFSKTTEETKERLNRYLKWFKETDMWVFENQERLAKILAVIESLNPPVRTRLEMFHTDSENLRQELENIKKELAEFYGQEEKKIKEEKK